MNAPEKHCSNEHCKVDEGREVEISDVLAYPSQVGWSAVETRLGAKWNYPIGS
jgi:hypothetical protein